MLLYNIKETTILETKLCSQSNFLSAEIQVQTQPVTKLTELELNSFVTKQFF